MATLLGILGLTHLHGQVTLDSIQIEETPKEADLLTDHFVKWYNLVVTKDRIY